MISGLVEDLAPFPGRKRRPFGKGSRCAVRGALRILNGRCGRPRRDFAGNGVEALERSIACGANILIVDEQAELVHSFVSWSLVVQGCSTEEGVLHGRVCSKLCGTSLANDPPRLEQISTLGNGKACRHILFHQQKRNTGLLHAAQSREKLFHDNRRKAKAGFVEQKISLISARPMATICCSPPDMVRTS